MLSYLRNIDNTKEKSMIKKPQKYLGNRRQFKKKLDNLSWLSCQKLEMSVFDTLSYMNSFLGDSRMSGGQEILGLSNWILAV